MLEINPLKIRTKMSVYTVGLHERGWWGWGGLLRGALSVGGHLKVIRHSPRSLLVSPVILQSKPCLLGGKCVQCSWGVFPVTWKCLHLNDLFPFYAITHLHIPTLLNLSVSVFSLFSAGLWD